MPDALSKSRLFNGGETDEQPGLESSPEVTADVTTDPANTPDESSRPDALAAAWSESEMRFRAIFENSGSGMALVDMQGHPVECNPALQNLLGYSEEELCGMAFTEFTHPDDRELDWGLYSELTAGKRDKYEIAKRFITKDGHLIWANLIVSLVKDRDGIPRYAVGMVQDVTERKRAEDELLRVSERLQLATTAATLGI
jgi:PAS domain S-box-containing protein